ncbi:HdeD family acid-resistance protein [Williamsia sterculiae]|uniref:Uncharacterized membrane protein HdeD, DUF308 family n=1 Tax=Williamsia sterculiae TaxID=1344003 RepID=A0A1N7CQ64_9NOCA|nr:DUF308 domain-containing protein [Williamsia sterculiae]SIR65594.1 Uncharacterized membrane protein HdeD, DUF308 family [Williamsia sterculiae]
MTTYGDARSSGLDALRARIRGPLIGAAVLGILLGIIALVWPGPTLLVVAVLFGISLIVAGGFRVSVAVFGTALPSGLRALFGVLGVLIIIVGIICLFDPAESLVLLALTIGIGWIFQGVHELMSDRPLGAPRWLTIASGVISILAGIVVIASPALAVGTFLTLGAILLIVVSVANLCTLARRA